MEEGGPTLCFPDGEKTCFACCPPIRPAGYDHSDYEGLIKRVLRENTRAYVPEETEVRPITGFSCWALGYLDPGCRLVGCLLHPARHQGIDLRFRVDFEEKCRREICPEAGVFKSLDDKTRAFWLQLTRGMDSFSYSSRRNNPLFLFLNWGPDLLKMIAEQGSAGSYSATSLVKAFPFLASGLSPKASAYPVRHLASIIGPDLFCDPGLIEAIEPGLAGLVDSILREAPFLDSPGACPVHRLHMDRSFLDFLRLSAGIRRIEPERAGMLKELVDDSLERLARRIYPLPVRKGAEMEEGVRQGRWDMAEESAREKFERLTRALKGSGPLIVALSGGVDSTFLLEASRLALGKDVVAATARGPLFPERELDRASGFCRDRDITHVMLPFDPVGLETFYKNSPDRCYVCKRTMSARLMEFAGEMGIKRVAHGANLDDLDDYRPGLEAARELGLWAPLMDARLRKDEIRRLSRDMGLTSWDLPSRACLASRVPYGERITREVLERIDLAERFFEEAGFLQVRVRHHDRLARVEIPPGDMGRILEHGVREAIIERLRAIGFLHVAIDLEGYITGSLNRRITMG